MISIAKRPMTRKTGALAYVKNLAWTGLLMSGYAGTASFGKIRIADKSKRLTYFTRNIAVWARRALEMFHFEVKTFGFDPKLMRERTFLLVSNHMSYMDILVLSTVQPCVFVTSVDMGEQFFLGPMAEMGGSIFIERRHRGQVDRDLTTISETLRLGHHVVIYPEGTSSNGERVLPFKKSLLMAAVEAGVDIMPLVLKYTEIDGEPFGPQNCDKICWYGKMNFLPHILGLMKLKSVKVELHFTEPIHISKTSTRQEIAEACQSRISEIYGEPFATLSSDASTRSPRFEQRHRL